MAESEVERKLKRFKEAVSRKSNFTELYRDAQEYSAPQRETFDEEFPGQYKDAAQKVFDSTAQQAVMTFASNIQSSITPPMKRFIELRPGTLLKENEELKKQLTVITEVLFDALHNSNFDTQISESYLDLSIGTGSLLVLPGTRSKPFNFTNIPLSQIFLEEGAHGSVDTVFRQHKLAARNIMDQWEDAIIGAELKEIIEKKPEAMQEFVECTTPADIQRFDPQLNDEVTVKGYEYSVIHKKTKTQIVSRTFRTSPWIIFRWANLPGEVYGRGPVLTALPAIKTLNEQVKILLQAASIATLGMYTVADDGIVNIENIKLGGGAMIPVSSNPGSIQGPTLSPLTPPGSPNLAQLIIENQQTAINKMLFGDPLGDVNLPVKTATEISLRQQELAKRIGSAFGKLQFELVSPLISRLLDILDELGLVDLGPFRVDGQTIAIEHVSPLAMAQDEEDIVRHIRFVETLVGLYGPEIAATLAKPDVFARYLDDKLSLIPGLVPSKEEVEQIKQVAAQQVQAAQQPQ